MKTVTCMYMGCTESITLKHAFSKHSTYCPEHKKTRIRESNEMRHKLFSVSQQKVDTAHLRKLLHKERYTGGAGVWEVMIRTAT